MQPSVIEFQTHIGLQAMRFGDTAHEWIKRFFAARETLKTGKHMFFDYSDNANDARTLKTQFIADLFVESFRDAPKRFTLVTDDEATCLETMRRINQWELAYRFPDWRVKTHTGRTSETGHAFRVTTLAMMPLRLFGTDVVIFDATKVLSLEAVRQAAAVLSPLVVMGCRVIVMIEGVYTDVWQAFREASEFRQLEPKIAKKINDAARTNADSVVAPLQLPFCLSALSSPQTTRVRSVSL